MKISYNITSTAIFFILLTHLTNPACLNGSIKTSESSKSVDKCKKKQDTINRYINSGGKQNIIKAADIAVTVPFDNSCGTIHYRVIDLLTGSGLYTEKYNRFIIETIRSISDPSIDYRTTYCLRYISSDGIINSNEWAAALNMIRTGKSISLPVYFRYLFTGSIRDSGERVEKRISEIIDSASKRGFGYKRSVAMPDLIFILAQGFQNSKPIDYKSTAHILKKYKHFIPDSDEYNRKAALIYSKMFHQIPGKRGRISMLNRVLNDFAGFMKGAKKSEGPAYFLVDIALSIERKIRHTGDAFFIGHLSRLNREMADWFCFSLTSTRYMNRITARKKYIKRNRIQCKQDRK